MEASSALVEGPAAKKGVSPQRNDGEEDGRSSIQPPDTPQLTSLQSIPETPTNDSRPRIPVTPLPPSFLGGDLSKPFANSDWGSFSPVRDIYGASTSYSSITRTPKQKTQTTDPSSVFIYPTPHPPPEYLVYRPPVESPESPSKKAASRPAEAGSKPKPDKEDALLEALLNEPLMRTPPPSSPLRLGPTPRAKRARNDEDTVIEDVHRSPVQGVTTTPRKGRRVALKDDIFEKDSALPIPGSSASPTRPSLADIQHPVPDPIKRWLRSSSPKREHTLERRLSTPELTEKEERQKKRLSMFTQRDFATGSLEPLSHVVGGRVLQPAKNGRISHSPPEGYSDPRWPDDQYPWSLAETERATHDQERRQQELKMIARYLASETEDEDEGEVDSFDMKRGWRAIPTEDGKRTIHVPTDPGDALTALLAHSHARRVAIDSNLLEKARGDVIKDSLPSTNDNEAPLADNNEHSQHSPAASPGLQGKDSMDDVVGCICQGTDDGRTMVQCDACQTWHHLECIGKKYSELKGKWFCWKCSNVDEGTLFPIFVPPSTPGKSTRNPALSDLPMYQHNGSLLQPSPMVDLSRKRDVAAPRTPPRSVGRPQQPQWIHETPITGTHLDDGLGVYRASQYDDLGTFDVQSTPSRGLGLRFSQPFIPATPQRLRTDRPWQNYGTNFMTPHGPTKVQFAPYMAPPSVLPTVPTDPLFIHYEHDAPKQTSHHAPAPPKIVKGKGPQKKGKGKDATATNAVGGVGDEIGDAPLSGTADSSADITERDLLEVGAKGE